MAQFSQLDELKTNSSLMIADEAYRFNARGRVLRPYEWAAMLTKSVPGNQEFITDTIKFIRCNEFKPSLILTVIATNGRLESLLTRKLGIRVQVEKISPCG